MILQDFKTQHLVLADFNGIFEGCFTPKAIGTKQVKSGGLEFFCNSTGALHSFCRHQCVDADSVAISGIRVNSFSWVEKMLGLNKVATVIVALPKASLDLKLISNKARGPLEHDEFRLVLLSCFSTPIYTLELEGFSVFVFTRG
jgi:hypothetical protein